ncbi:PIN domain-like protein [Naviculisporaceae sp. PSN 640]
MTVVGLWNVIKDLTPGRNVKLATLAAECFREKGRPLRIAVDTPLALFEYKTATAKAFPEQWGGMNHPVRVFFFHVQHLLASGVQPIFVFDGPNKPPEKGSAHPHNPRDCPHIASLLQRTMKNSPRAKEDIDCEGNLSHIIPCCRILLEHMGLPYRDAPAEAEAECAAMEKAGIVDAVLTRDGDAFVFGSRRVMRKQVAENKAAMVHEYRMDKMEPKLQDHLFLLAMMSGGDYNFGVRGCGEKLAMELARQHDLGFKLRSLLQNSHQNGNPKTAQQWKNEVINVLSSGNGLRQRWRSVAESVQKNNSFPSRTIAEYYLQPLVSTNIRAPPVSWGKDISLDRLRAFTREVFDWQHRHFAGKFVRVLALPCLTWKLLLHGATGTDGSGLIEDITLSKEDGKDEDCVIMIRVQFIPANVVTINIMEEAINLDFRANLKLEVFNPAEPVKEWVPQWIVEYGAPSAFRVWEKRQASKTKEKKRSISSTGNEDNAGPAPKRGRGRPRKEPAPQMRTPEGRPQEQQPEVIVIPSSP